MRSLSSDGSVKRVPRSPGIPAFVLAAAIALAAPALVIAGLVPQGAQQPQPLADIFTDLVREPAIAYFTTPANDPVARLNQRIRTGAITLAYDPNQGYLRSILAALQLNVDSQMLVFSKTSVQAIHINPRNPRALYFNDAVSVGYIRDAPFLEFAAQDPRQGVIFYTLDQRQT